jgi:hypothetical protein
VARIVESGFGLVLRLGLEVVAAAVARGLPMAPLPVRWVGLSSSLWLSRSELTTVAYGPAGSTEREAARAPYR